MKLKLQYEREGRALVREVARLKSLGTRGYEQLTESGVFRELQSDPMVVEDEVWDFRVQALANLALGVMGLQELSCERLSRPTHRIFEAVCTAIQQQRYWSLQREFRCSAFVAAVLTRDLRGLLQGGTPALLRELLRLSECAAAVALQAWGLTSEELIAPEEFEEPYLGAVLLRACLIAGDRRLNTRHMLEAVLAEERSQGRQLLGMKGIGPDSLQSLESPFEATELEGCSHLAPVSELSRVSFAEEQGSFVEEQWPMFVREPALDLKFSSSDHSLARKWSFALAVFRSATDTLRPLREDQELASEGMRDPSPDWFLRLAWQARSLLLEDESYSHLGRRLRGLMYHWREFELLEAPATHSLSGHLDSRLVGSLALFRAFLRDPRCGANRALAHQSVQVEKLCNALWSLTEVRDDLDALSLALGKATLAARERSRETNTADVLAALAELRSQTTAGEVLAKLEIDPERLRIWADRQNLEL